MTPKRRSRRNVGARGAAQHGAKSHHLGSLEIKDFKSLKDVKVELGQINVFVGANGSGKSNLLEAVGILGAAASGVIDDQALLRRGVRPGVPEVYKSSFEGERMAPKISLRGRSVGGVDYHAYITNPSQKIAPYWLFGNESIVEGKVKRASRGPKGNARALGLSMPLEKHRSVTALMRASQRTSQGIRDFFDALDQFAIFAPVTPVLRGIAPDPAPRAPVGLYGGQLPEAVGLLQNAGAKKGKGRRENTAFEDLFGLIDWAEAVSLAQPSPELVPPSVPTSRYILEFTDRFMAAGRKTLSGYDASEGALYILFMLVLAVHGQSPPIYSIDNFDQALNPRTARALTRMFVTTALAHDRQVFLTTHNPLVLDGLALNDPRIRLFTVARDRKGHTKIVRVPVKNLDALKAKEGEFAISRLWVQGRLGGMPEHV